MDTAIMLPMVPGRNIRSIGGPSQIIDYPPQTPKFWFGKPGVQPKNFPVDSDLVINYRIQFLLILVFL